MIQFFQEEVTMAKAAKPVPEGFHTLTPYLVFDGNAAEAIDWYTRAFGAVDKGRSVGPDGKILHAEVRIGDSPFMVHDAMMGTRGPKALGGSPVSLWIYVEDCDALYQRAAAAGAGTGNGPMGKMADQFWGDRCGMVTDPYGYSWTIATRKEDLTPEEVDRRQKEFMKGFAQQTQA
jgi:uncharacterized glyoxalase superfamily protein PhnB